MEILDNTILPNNSAVQEHNQLVTITYQEMSGDRGKFLGVVQLDGAPFEIFDRSNSHFADHPFGEHLLQKALKKLNLHSEPDPSKYLKEIVDLGEVAGKTDCIKLTEEGLSKTLYAVRKNRIGYSRCVLKNPQDETQAIELPDCNFITLLISRGYNRFNQLFKPYLILITAYVGEGAPRELYERYYQYEPKEFKEAQLFWLGDGEHSFGHALAVNTDDINTSFPLLQDEEFLGTYPHIDLNNG